MTSDATAAQKKPQTARIRYAAMDQNLPVVGKTVGQVRQELSDPVTGWNIPAGTNGFAGKQQLEDSHVIQPGEDINFFRKLGEKG